MDKPSFNFKDPCTRAIYLSLATSFIMLIGKIGAFKITRSTAIFADAAESVVHLFAISIATYSLWYSRQPADEDHQYGHGKIAYFSAAGEAAVILITSLSIIYLTIASHFDGAELKQLDTGISIIALLSIINFSLGKYLIYTGEKYNSLILIANGKHVLTDVWTSLGVVTGVGIVWLTGLTWIDPLIAIGVALCITWTAFSLLKNSFDGLMEKVDEETSKKISSILDEAVQSGTILSFHQLRHRKVNERLWIEAHLLFKEDMTVKEAHAKACKIEIAITKAFPQNKLYITTHMEPEHHEESHPKDHPEICNMA
ncbi:MAG: cation diffusion facilitator family transporter [Chlamydiales bacterium]|jgi:cation diffusion facilitator family transporter